MFRQMLFVQWKWSRELLAFFVLLGFAIPVLVSWAAMPTFGAPSARGMIAIGQAIGIACLVLAILSGVVIALQGWNVDERAGHVYALSLPIARWRFLAQRAAGALVLLAAPALAVALGGGLVAGQLELPGALQAYPVWLAVRMLLAAWLTHACAFAVRYSAGRRAKAIFLVLLLAFGVLAALTEIDPRLRHTIFAFRDFLSSNPGPFGIFFGRWTLIDV